MALEEAELAVFDMDGVLTKHSSSWRFIHEKFGVDNSKIYLSYSGGEISYADFLAYDVKLWMAKQEKIPRSQIIGYMNEIPLMDNLLEGLNEIKSHGIRIAIVSGGVSWLADRLAKSFPFDFVYCNEILTDSDDNLIPKGNIGVIPNKKDVVIKEIQDSEGFNVAGTVSVGDSDFDASMFKRSGLGISFNSSSSELMAESDVIISSTDFLDVVRTIVEQ